MLIKRARARLSATAVLVALSFGLTSNAVAVQPVGGTEDGDGVVGTVVVEEPGASEADNDGSSGDGSDGGSGGGEWVPGEDERCAGRTPTNPIPVGPPEFPRDGGFGPNCWIPSGEEGSPGISIPDAAYRYVVEIEFQPPEIGMAPQVNPEWGHRRTYVGLPVWLWVANPTSMTWGPYHSSHDLGGIVFTFDAQVDRIVWDMGDGTTVTCGLGTAYVTTYGNTDSPGCGHRYETTSADQPNGKYPVSATSYWNVNWSAGGQSGTIPLQLTSSTEVEVRELQSVNVPPGAVDGG